MIISCPRDAVGTGAAVANTGAGIMIVSGGGGHEFRGAGIMIILCPCEGHLVRYFVSENG